MNTFHDDDLRTSFEELRELDRQRAPRVSHVLARRVARPRSFALAAAWTAVLATAIMVIVATRSDNAGAPVDPISTWRAPSDALLELTRPAPFQQFQAGSTAALNTLVPIRTPSSTPSGTR